MSDPSNYRTRSAGLRPGALILGNEYQALGILRQLAPLGFACALVDQDRWGISRFSRFRARFHRSPRYITDEFWPWLQDIAHRFGYEKWLLVPTDDEQVLQIARNYDSATQRFRYLGPSWQEYEKLYDKRKLFVWCRDNDIRVPRTFLPLSRTETLTGHLDFPFIVKPAVKHNYYKYTNRKAIVVESPKHLISVLNGTLRSVDIEELLYQEIIPGDGHQQWSYAGLFCNGEVIAGYTACRRRQHPPDFGRASTYVIAEHDPEVESESRRVISALRYSGLGEVEWKRDPKNGELKFLEVNARCWGWHSLSVPVIGNLPRMLYELHHGERYGQVSPDYGWRWVKFATDIPVAMDLWRRGELTTADYLRSLQGRVTSCDWDRSDPVPFLMQIFLIPYLAVTRGY